MAGILNSIKKSRVFYFLYFIKKTKWPTFFQHMDYVAGKFKRSKTNIFLDVLSCSFTYRSSFHEYFYYKFYEKSPEERAKFATAGLMFEYQLKMNPAKYRYYIEDKIEFLKKYSDYAGRDWLDLEKCQPAEADAFLAHHPKFVLKNARGQAGENIKVMSADKLTEPLLAYAKKNSYDLIEAFVEQHEALMQLSPSSLNTIRVITQVNDKNEVDFLGATLRLSIGSNTDNLSTGGIAIPVDIQKGIVIGPGVSFNIISDDVYTHPVSKIDLVNYQLPFWSEVLEITAKAALHQPENRSIGWDVAIKPSGPILIEGNHNWGARLWQMPYNAGFKSRIINYIR